MAKLSTMRTDYSTTIKEYIEAVVAKEVDRIIENHKKQMETEIDEVRQDVIARSAMRIARYTDVQMVNDRLIITMENPTHSTKAHNNNLLKQEKSK